MDSFNNGTGLETKMTIKITPNHDKSPRGDKPMCIEQFSYTVSGSKELVDMEIGVLNNGEMVTYLFEKASMSFAGINSFKVFKMGIEGGEIGLFHLVNKYEKRYNDPIAAKIGSNASFAEVLDLLQEFASERLKDKLVIVSNRPFKCTWMYLGDDEPVKLIEHLNDIDLDYVLSLNIFARESLIKKTITNSGIVVGKEGETDDLIEFINLPVADQEKIRTIINENLTKRVNRYMDILIADRNNGKFIEAHDIETSFDKDGSTIVGMSFDSFKDGIISRVKLVNQIKMVKDLRDFQGYLFANKLGDKFVLVQELNPGDTPVTKDVMSALKRELLMSETDGVTLLTPATIKFNWVVSNNGNISSVDKIVTKDEAVTMTTMSLIDKINICRDKARLLRLEGECYGKPTIIKPDESDTDMLTAVLSENIAESLGITGISLKEEFKFTQKELY